MTLWKDISRISSLAIVKVDGAGTVRHQDNIPSRDCIDNFKVHQISHYTGLVLNLLVMLNYAGNACDLVIGPQQPLPSTGEHRVFALAAAKV